jgi:hypothetical protein
MTLEKTKPLAMIIHEGKELRNEELDNTLVA